MELVLKKIQKISPWHILAGLIVGKALVSSLSIYDIFWVGGAILVKLNLEFFRVFFESAFIEVVCLFINVGGKLKGYEVMIHLNPQEYRNLTKKRALVYKKIGYIEDQSIEFFPDLYDLFSKNIIVKKRGKMLGAIRMTFGNDVVGTTTENYFGLALNKQDKIACVGRWISLVESKNKNQKKEVFLLLMSNLILNLKRDRVRTVIFDCPLKVLNYLEKNGLEFERIHIPKEKYGKISESREEINGCFKKHEIIPNRIDIKKQLVRKVLKVWGTTLQHR